MSGAYNYMTFDSSELDNIKDSAMFLFTHKHADHYSRKNLRKALKNKNGTKLNQRKISKLKDSSNAIPNFTIESFKSKHRFSINHHSYLITWHNKKIYLSGDTESAKTIGKVKDIDWAFIPNWVIYYAKKEGVVIDAKMKDIYHLYPNEKINGNLTDDYKPLRKQNEIITIPF
jgi:L-ascorbate metabolism protein UlaG (beta-lactamase superfamily)